MAQKVQVILVDDLDGGQAEETVSFSLDGVEYEIDLSTDHAAQLRSSLEQYVAVARKIQRAPRGRRVTRTQVGPSANVIREWARSNGYEVNMRGRISSEIREAYEAAN
ncbi:histone-like nucleoid-structuring protein Lsr2 [Jonesia quinghaiensis]|uniref:histone-like nucleoid-structuring protein Lsr2 n=1 Tax=Jonesia quinghaiensis TaxID=262806 RepID=UPI000411815C|nr:Lsr2 family protein [Jonesia quinghaiensis]